MTRMPITRAGFAGLQTDLEHLTTTRRQQVAERLRTAVATDGNMFENGDYHDARDEQMLLERRIAMLEHQIAAAEVRDPDPENGMLDLGERVRLRDIETEDEIEFELVGSPESDPSLGRLSAASPLGRALLGRQQGDIAIVDAPRGQLQFEVLEIAAA